MLRKTLSPCSDRGQAGFHVVELVVVLAILSFVLTLGLPAFLDWTSGLRLDLTAMELTGILRGARSFAIRHSANVAVKFHAEADGTVTYALYRDGNGNGVLNADIASGADPAVTPPHRIDQLGNRVRLGFPPGPPARDPTTPSRFLHPGDDPIRFNQSDLASFTAIGGATPGSLFLTDGRSRLMTVRVTGMTGRVRVMRYDFAAQIWR